MEIVLNGKIVAIFVWDFILKFIYGLNSFYSTKDVALLEPILSFLFRKYIGKNVLIYFSKSVKL